MTALSTAKRLYLRAGLDLARDIGLHLELGGVVHCDPLRVLLARPMRLAVPETWPLPGEADAWYVTFAVGRKAFEFFIQQMPYFLPQLAWQRQLRGSSRLHVYDTNRFINFNRRFH